jgi:hypothetical protein
VKQEVQNIYNQRYAHVKRYKVNKGDDKKNTKRLLELAVA